MVNSEDSKPQGRAQAGAGNIEYAVPDSERGASLVEYVLLIALIAAVLISGLVLLSQNMSERLSEVTEPIEG